MKIRWTPELSTGVEQIDEEHKELVDRMGRFLDACSAGQGKSQATSMLDFLEEYALTHFAHEEALMMQTGYPGAPSHRAQHVTFRKNIARIRDEFEKDGASVHIVVMVNRTVIEWMINHIRATDRELGTYLLARESVA